MREIDLIPRDHIDERRARRVLRHSVIALAAVVAVVALARVAVGVAITRERPLVDRMRQAEQLAGAQRAQFAQLTAKKAELESRLASWRSLQQGAPWRPALARIDSAFGRGLWFDQLALQRAQPPADAALAASAAGAATPTRHPATLEVKGHALDHAALTAFTRMLGEQPGLRGVRLLDTGLRRYSMAEIVDFTVVARLEAPEGASP